MCGDDDSLKETEPEAPTEAIEATEATVIAEDVGPEAPDEEAVREEDNVSGDETGEVAESDVDIDSPPQEAPPQEAAPQDDTADKEAPDGDEAPEDLEVHVGEDWGAGLPQERLLSRIESLIFTSPEPVSVRRMARILSMEGKAVRALADTLKAHYANRGIILEEVSKGYQFRSHPDNAAMIRDVFKLKPVKMSRAALETLAIVAYRQPLTRAEVEQIRGVDSGGVLKYLFEKELVRVIGRKEEPGRPIIYGTSKAFLELFGLKSLSDLPALHEFSELWEEHQKLVDEEAPLSEDNKVQSPASAGEENETAKQTSLDLATAEERSEMDEKKEKEVDKPIAERAKDQSEVPTETLNQDELIALMRNVDLDRDPYSETEEEEETGLSDDADDTAPAPDDEESL